MIQNKEKWFSFGIMCIPILSIYLVTQFLSDVYGTLFSVQIFIVISGTIVVMVLLLARIFDYPIKINQLNPKTATLYFSSINNFMLAIFAGFGIAFSILWGSLYTYAINVGKLGYYTNNLKWQGIILIVFLICTSTAIFFSYLLPLIHQINKK